MMKIFSFFILILSITCLFGETFNDLFDEEFHFHVRNISGTSNFQSYYYNGYKFAVLKDQEQVRFFIISSDFSDIIGYRGVTTLGIIFNSDLSVEKLEIIKSDDTRGYLRRLLSMGFLQRFQNFRLGDEIEIVTGATMTSEAMIATVNECIEIFALIVTDISE